MLSFQGYNAELDSIAILREHKMLLQGKITKPVGWFLVLVMMKERHITTYLCSLWQIKKLFKNSEKA